MNTNTLKGLGIEFHILQSFPVTCLNRDDVGAPKSAMVGGVPRARVSSQCWKRQVRLALHDFGVTLAVRTKRLASILQQACEKQGANAEQATACAEAMAGYLTKDTLLFISGAEVERLATLAKEVDFVAAKISDKNALKCLDKVNKAVDGLDIALFGRMVAQEPTVNVTAAASFSHAISTHRASNEVEFFTALDDLQEEPGSAHMGSLEYNSATYYRYVSIDLGQLQQNLGGEQADVDDICKAVETFVKALYVAVPAARQATQSGACLWDYARVLVRKGQRMQLAFDEPVRARGGYLKPSIEAMDAALARNESLCGSLYGKFNDFTFGRDATYSIDNLCADVVAAIRQQESQA